MPVLPPFSRPSVAFADLKAFLRNRDRDRLLGGALALLITAMLKAASGRLTGYVCTYGIGYQASGLACVAWYPALSSREVGVCDEGTGLPVGLLYCVGALLVAAELISTGRRS